MSEEEAKKLDEELSRLDKEIAVAEKQKQLQTKKNELKALGGPSNSGKAFGLVGSLAGKFWHWMVDK